MDHPRSSWSIEPPEQLTDALRELDNSADECAELLPALLRLAEWQAPPPQPADTRRLLARLMTELPAHSPVRQAIREHRRHRVAFVLATARAQVSLFGLDFWLVSALITLIGVAVVLGGVAPDQALVLRISGPLLAYLGTVVAFRARDERVLELELVCLPSPLQLTLARLVIVLGYDVGLSLGLSLALWAGGAGRVLTLTLAWLMPLLLVTGLALVLTLRLSVPAAASVAYGSWLAFLAVSVLSTIQANLLTPAVALVPGGVGLTLLAIALLRINSGTQRLLPRP